MCPHSMFNLWFQSTCYISKRRQRLSPVGTIAAVVRVVGAVRRSLWVSVLTGQLSPPASTLHFSLEEFLLKNRHQCNKGYYFPSFYRFVLIIMNTIEGTDLTNRNTKKSKCVLYLCKKNWTSFHREQTGGYQERVREGWTGNSVSADANCYRQDGQTTRSYCVLHGTIVNIPW